MTTTRYRSSSIPLEGDRAPKTTTVTFHGVPAGEYQLTAVLIVERGRTNALGPYEGHGRRLALTSYEIEY